MSENPFRTLGILPSALEHLSEAEIFELVGVTFRARAKMFHPDVGTSPSKAKLDALTRARDDLDLENARPSFDYWTARHRALAQRDASDDTELRRSEARLSQLQDAAQRHWQSLLSLPVPAAPLFDERQVYFDISPFQLPPCRLLVRDLLQGAFEKAEKGKSVFLFDINGPPFELSVDSDGNLFRTEVEDVRWIKKKEDSRDEAVSEKSRFHFRRVGEPRALSDLRLIGTVIGSPRHPDKAFEWDRTVSLGALTPVGKRREKQFDSERRTYFQLLEQFIEEPGTRPGNELLFSVEGLKLFLPRFIPWVRFVALVGVYERTCLLVGQETSGPEPRYCFLGEILDIHPAT